MRSRTLLVPVAFLLAAIAALSLWRAQLPLEYDENYARLIAGVADRVMRYPLAARALCSRMLELPSWGMIWPLTGIAAAAALRARDTRRFAAPLLAASGAVLFVYATMYTVTNWSNLEELAVSSANRLLMHLLPFAALLLASGANAFDRNNA
jgi:hypothetical protein